MLCCSSAAMRLSPRASVSGARLLTGEVQTKGCIFHNWIGCRCSKCGKIRDDRHSWRWQSRQDGLCYEYCSCCGKINTKAPHQWEPVPGTCEERCKKCGITRKAHHFTGISGVCKERCTACGKIRKIDHIFEWDGCLGTCTRCGFQTHKWNQLTGSAGSLSREGCKCTVCGAINRNGVHTWETVKKEGNETLKRCTVCGRTDTFYDRPAGSFVRERSMEEELIKEDSLHDMRAMGIKC